MASSAIWNVIKLCKNTDTENGIIDVIVNSIRFAKYLSRLKETKSPVMTSRGYPEQKSDVSKTGTIFINEELFDG
jgi:hypothetical protein